MIKVLSCALTRRFRETGLVDSCTNPGHGWHRCCETLRFTTTQIPTRIRIPTQARSQCISAEAITLAGLILALFFCRKTGARQTNGILFFEKNLSVPMRGDSIGRTHGSTPWRSNGCFYLLPHCHIKWGDSTSFPRRLHRLARPEHAHSLHSSPQWTEGLAIYVSTGPHCRVTATWAAGRYKNIGKTQ
jgi:hypothetical protein